MSHNFYLFYFLVSYFKTICIVVYCSNTLELVEVRSEWVPLLCVFFQSSVLGSGFGELGGPKLGQTAGQQILEQLKGPGLGQLTSQPSSTGTNCTPVVGLVGTGMSVPSSSSWDIKPPGTQSSTSLPSQFSRKCYSCFTEPGTNLFSLANTWLCINTLDLFTPKSDVSTQIT